MNLTALYPNVQSIPCVACHWLGGDTSGPIAALKAAPAGSRILSVRWSNDSPPELTSLLNPAQAVLSGTIPTGPSLPLVGQLAGALLSHGVRQLDAIVVDIECAWAALISAIAANASKLPGPYLNLVDADGNGYWGTGSDLLRQVCTEEANGLIRDWVQRTFAPLATMGGPIIDIGANTGRKNWRVNDYNGHAMASLSPYNNNGVASFNCYNSCDQFGPQLALRGYKFLDDTWLGFLLDLDCAASMAAANQTVIPCLGEPGWFGGEAGKISAAQLACKLQHLQARGVSRCVVFNPPSQPNQPTDLSILEQAMAMPATPNVGSSPIVPVDFAAGVVQSGSLITTFAEWSLL